MQHYFQVSMYQCLFVWLEKESQAIGWKDASSLSQTLRLPPFAPLEMSVWRIVPPLETPFVELAPTSPFALWCI